MIHALDEKNEIKSFTWPILQYQNIFILPGIPHLFKTKLQIIIKDFIHPMNKALIHIKVYLNCDERDIVTILNSQVDKFPNIKFGSYP